MDKVLRNKIKRYLNLWVKQLGLGMWRIDAYYYDNPLTVMKEFAAGENEIVYAEVTSDWRYMKAAIKFNMPALTGKTDEEIEASVVHELCHILVCEMRTDGVDHEERVVTGLQLAFMWTREAGRK